MPCSQIFPVKIQHIWDIRYLRGLTLRTKELGAALQAWPAGLFGLGSILLFTPFLAQFLVQIQFFPREFITGLAMFCCMPTTLSSGVTLTQLAGGNSALALAMTVISNLLGIMFVPLSLAKYIGTGAGVSLPTKELFRSLVNTLLVPLILGKVCSYSYLCTPLHRFCSVISIQCIV
uniref:Sodium/metabolite cotransporter BASS4, chloroplastic n=1 Tax=Aegilops tauschii subsp. strangulata TaxID=200361 RepID=A0A453EGZ2_AEGTS